MIANLHSLALGKLAAGLVGASVGAALVGGAVASPGAAVGATDQTAAHVGAHLAATPTFDARVGLSASTSAALTPSLNVNAGSVKAHKAASVDVTTAASGSTTIDIGIGVGH